MIMQMDVETVFLNRTIKLEVFVKQPMGYDDKSGKACKLSKALYGLRESSRALYKCFDEYMKQLGFQRSESDYCLYMKCKSDDVIYLILFVDDLLICRKNKRKIDEVKNKLSNKFAMRDLGEVKTYLGINIEYDHKRLDQSSYIESLARQCNIENSVAALNSKLPNGFCPVTRYTKTLPFEQDDCQMSIHSHRISAASLRTRYKS